jgi:hypothetical protein
LPIFVGNDSCEQPKAIPFLDTFKISAITFSFGTATCVPLFEQVDEKGANRFQESISERLHNHSFSNILFYLPLDSH